MPQEIAIRRGQTHTMTLYCMQYLQANSSKHNSTRRSHFTCSLPIFYSPFLRTACTAAECNQVKSRSHTHFPIKLIDDWHLYCPIINWMIIALYKKMQNKGAGSKMLSGITQEVEATLQYCVKKAYLKTVMIHMQQQFLLLHNSCHMFKRLIPWTCMTSPAADQRFVDKCYRKWQILTDESWDLFHHRLTLHLELLELQWEMYVFMNFGDRKCRDVLQ